jgi:iron complex outermembrane receptor protein
MNYYKLLFSILLLSLISFPSFAQNQKITGKVTDSNGQPLGSVTIRARASGNSTATNKEGSFTIDAKTGDVLEASSIGYKFQFLSLSGQSEIAIKLEASYGEIGEVILVGSRGVGRVKTESPVPVDVIHVNDMAQTTAKPDLMSQLNMSVPSFNYNKQSGGDGSDAIDFASLRGLGFDQTLVLVNGKRRHLSAFVNQVGTRGRGNSGTDLNAIPY